MKQKRFEGWLQKIYHTQDEEINCSECFDAVSHYVELEVTGGDPGLEMPKVQHHLQQCNACREEYEVLRDLRLLEEEDEAPSLDDLQNLIP